MLVQVGYKGNQITANQVQMNLSNHRNSYEHMKSHEKQYKRGLSKHVTSSSMILLWKMHVITIKEDEREMIVTYVSKFGLQMQTKEADGCQTSS